MPANIAEGRARSTRRDFANFLAIAKGSLAETETLLLIADRLGLIGAQDSNPALQLMDEVGKMLSALRKKLAENGQNLVPST